jgi:hypothetical protein
MSKKYKLRNKKGSGLGLTVEIGTPGLRNKLKAEEIARTQATQGLVNDYLANLNDYKFADDYTLNSINNLTYEQVDKLIQTKILLKDLPYKKLAPKKTTVIKVGKKNLLYMGKINDTITEIPGFFGFGGTPLQKVGNGERNVYLGDDGNFYLNKFLPPAFTFFPKQVYIEYKNKKPSSIPDPNYSPNNLLVKPPPQALPPPQQQGLPPQQQGPPPQQQFQKGPPYPPPPQQQGPPYPPPPQQQGPPPQQQFQKGPPYPPPPQQQGLPPQQQGPPPQAQAGGFLTQDPKIYIFSFSETYAGGNKKPTTKKQETKKTTTKKPTTKKPTTKKQETKKPTTKKPTTKKQETKKTTVKKPTTKKQTTKKQETKKPAVKKPTNKKNIKK